MAKQNPYLELHDGLILFQRKRRFEALSFGLGESEAAGQVSYTALAILYLLSGGDELNVKEIAEQLKLERSWVSRIVGGMEKDHLIKAYVPEEDKRSKKLNLTALGKETLTRSEKTMSEIMEVALSPMDGASKRRFAEILDTLAHNLDGPKFLKSKSAHPVDQGLSRLSWSLGVHSENMLGSGLNITQVQVLYALDEAKDSSVMVSDLDKVLPFDMSTISRTIDGFKARGVVKKEQSVEDKRSFDLYLTANGRELLRRYKDKAEEVFTKGLRTTTLSDLTKVILDLQEVLKSMPQTLARIRQQVEVRLLTAKSELAAFEKILPKVPPPENNAEGTKFERFGFFYNNELRGGAIVFRGERSGTLKKICFSTEVVGTDSTIGLLKECLKSAL